MHSIKEENIEKIVLELINKQIELNIDTEKAIKFITEKENINYDFEILNIQREETQNNLLKYNNLKNVLQTDFENNYISENDYKDYDLDYSNKIKINFKFEDEFRQSVEFIKIKKWVRSGRNISTSFFFNTKFSNNRAFKKIKCML